MISRRVLLTGLAISPLAGCLGRNGGDDATREDAQDTEDSTDDTDEGDDDHTGNDDEQHEPPANEQLFIETQEAYEAYNRRELAPGTQILFAEGAIFNGPFRVTHAVGTTTEPITIGAYDPDTNEVLQGHVENKPIINAQAETIPTEDLIGSHDVGGDHQLGYYDDVGWGLLLYNCANVEVSNLEITNTDGTDSPDTRSLIGIMVLADEDFRGESTPDEVNLVNNITIRNCHVHDVGGEVAGKSRGGIHVFANGRVKYDELVIEQNHVEYVGGVGIGNNQLDSAYAGIDPPEQPLLWENFCIRNNYIDHTGRNNLIFRENIDGVAEFNVLANSTRHGDGGHSIFNFDTIDCVMQYNEAYGNVAEEPQHDRGGFDADWNARGTKIQYNYSHDNFWSIGIMRRAINEDIDIRYNISQNERMGAYFYGFPWEDGLNNCRVYNNTHYFGEDIDEATIFVQQGDTDRTPIVTEFSNNIFYFAESGEIGPTPDVATTTFANNCYVNVPVPDGDASPLEADPLFTEPGTGGTAIDMSAPTRLSGYQLDADSPAIEAGEVIENNGGEDFWGTPLANSAPTIGAYEPDS